MLTKILFGAVAALGAGTGGYFMAGTAAQPATASVSSVSGCCNAGAPCCDPPQECCFLAKTEAKSDCCAPGAGCCASTEACCLPAAK